MEQEARFSSGSMVLSSEARSMQGGPEFSEPCKSSAKPKPKPVQNSELGKFVRVQPAA